MTRNSVNIGKDQFIPWIDCNPNETNPFNIDPLLETTWYFWEQLEIQCVTECCGIYAFSFWREDIQKTVSYFDKNLLLSQLEFLKTEIMNNKSTVLSSKKLDQSDELFDKTFFLKLLDHVMKNIE